MPNHLSDQNPNKPLDKQAKELEADGNFAQAAELYRQLYELSPENDFAVSRYLLCLRKLSKAAEAVAFGRSLSSTMRDKPYVHNAIAWAIYDFYFKKNEKENQDEEEISDIEGDLQSSNQYDQMQKAAKYVLKHSPMTDTLIRTKIVFAMCKEAKGRGRWQDMYDFVTQLDPESLSKQSHEWNGRKQVPDYQLWLYKMLKSLFELGRYGECLELAHKGVEIFPTDKLFPWWQALAKKELGHIEEALGELRSLDKRFQEWYIQRDIAVMYEQAHQYQDAWIWYCKAASLPGKLKQRYKILISMASLLQRLERWQDAYEHLQLAWMITKDEHWTRSAEMLQTQVTQFKARYSEHLQQENASHDFHILSRRLKTLWQREISATRPHHKGVIKTVNERSGFIKTDNGDYYFSLRDVPRYLSLEIGTEVEFELVESYDQKKQRESLKAMNIRLARHQN